LIGAGRRAAIWVDRRRVDLPETPYDPRELLEGERARCEAAYEAPRLPRAVRERAEKSVDDSIYAWVFLHGTVSLESV
jgi:hypothetical protein